MLLTKRFNLICGHYGTGKTNLSLNLALEAAKEGQKVTLVDMDLVNPYFRSSDYAAQLQHVSPHLIVVLVAFAGKLEVDDDEAFAVGHHAVGAHTVYVACFVAVEDGALVEQFILSREPVGSLGLREGAVYDVLYLVLCGGVDEAFAHHTGDG